MQSGEAVDLPPFTGKLDRPMMEMVSGSNIWYQAIILETLRNKLLVLFPGASQHPVPSTAPPLCARGTLCCREREELGHAAHPGVACVLAGACIAAATAAAKHCNCNGLCRACRQPALCLMRQTELRAQSLINLAHIATSRVMGACVLRSGFTQAAGAEGVGAPKQFSHLARLHVYTRMEVSLLGESLGPCPFPFSQIAIRHARARTRMACMRQQTDFLCRTLPAIYCGS